MRKSRVEGAAVEEESVSHYVPEHFRLRRDRIDVFDPDKQAIRDADQAFRKYEKELAPTELLK